jgi:type IV pilus assembly protein PilC
MKVFYKAKNYSGELRSGEIEIKNERDFANQLRSDGFILTSFKKLEGESEKKIDIKLLDRFMGISLKDKLMFSRNMAVMIASGLPLSRAVSNLAAQTKNKRFAKILDDIHSDIQAGLTFSEALSKFPGVFGDLFINMVHVGETSGNLEEVLEILSVQIEKEHDLISKVKGAMTYPAVIVVVMIGIGMVMMIYVLPTLLAVFKDMNADLPATTRFVIGISDFMQNHSILVLFLMIAFIFFVVVFRKTEPGKKTFGFLGLKIPLINNIVIKVNCARFCRIYSSLLKSGVPVLESLRIVGNTISNFYYKNAFQESIECVQKGIPLSKVIAKNKKIFPILVAQMIEVGEETGKTETVLLKLAEFYEAEVTQITKNMSSIIEPFLMVIIGIAVGFFAVSMLQPMYSLMGAIK